MMRNAILSLALSGIFVTSAGAPRGEPAVPLTVEISGLQMIARGRVGVVVTIAGLRPDLHPTIEGTATVGGQSIQGEPSPVIAARIPAAIDLPAGRVRIGGDASVAEFTPVPALEENTPIAVEITVRQSGAAATARRTGILLLPGPYAARVNIVGYSLGGLMARWNMAFDDGWDHLVNRFVMVGVPNEGAVMAYVGTWYPIAAPWARTPAARSLLPTFPYWRPATGAPWTFPPDAQNAALVELNTHPLPEGIRAYAFYGNQQPDAEGRGTWAGVTGRLPRAGFASGAGDGVVLVASALGLPINGGAGVAGLADRLVIQRELGALGYP